MIESYNEETSKQCQFDIVIPVDAKNVKFVGTVVKYLRLSMPDASAVYIVTNTRLFNKIKRNVGDDHYTLIDENKMIDGLSFAEVRRYMVESGCTNITEVGWYFQQLLKLGFALTSYCKNYYLTWDSDTLPISKLKFFKDGKPLFTMKKEYHRPYFDTIQRLIGMDKAFPKSFIAEHMIFKKEYVEELISEIESYSSIGGNWMEKIIKACDFSINQPLFSEFETYGTFCIIRHPDAYGEQYLNTFRGAAIIRGRHVNNHILEILSRDVDIASFELNDEMFPYNWGYIKWKVNGWAERLRTTPMSKLKDLIWKKITRFMG